MRLPTGEIEVVTASALEDAFRCGLADARTPVRSVGSPVWSALAEVAEIETSDPRSLGSLLPVSLEAPEADLENEQAWKIRREIDTSTMKPGRGRLALASMAIVGCIALAVVGGEKLSQNASAERFAQAHLARRVAATPEVPLPRATPERQEVLRALHDEQDDPVKRRAAERRVRELELIRRLKEAANPHRTERQHAKRSKTPIEPPASWNPSSTPFTDGGDPRDPLNGAL